MRTSRFTEEQIRYAVQQVEAGVGVAEFCRKYGVAQATFYRWRQKYGALTKTELARLKKLVAELTLDKQILQGRRYHPPRCRTCSPPLSPSSPSIGSDLVGGFGAVVV